MELILNNKTVTPCMIGTWAWGPGYNGSKMVFGETNSEEQLKETFETAYANGLNFWDTAEVYGMGTSEKLLGKFIEGKDDIAISTKHAPGKKYKNGENENAIKGSLERLNIKYIDLYWLHSPRALKENMKELAECLKKGLIKNIGLSNCNVEQIKEANEVLKQNGTKLYAIQNHYSLLAMEREAEILEYCKNNDIIFFGYMTLEQGALSGHYDEKNHFSLFSMRGLSFGKGKFKKIKYLLNYIKELGVKYDVDPSQIPIAWTISKGVFPIVGVTKSKHAKSLKQGISISLTDEEIKKLEELALASGVKCKGMWE